jgi:hypothetical protein
MDASDLRIALFSGNYNYVRDGANQALNRLVDYLLRQGGPAVRIYSPTVQEPAFRRRRPRPHPGDPVSGRAEYRAPVMIPPRREAGHQAVQPNIMPQSPARVLGHRAVTLAHKMNLPVIARSTPASRTYPRYYGLAFWSR